MAEPPDPQSYALEPKDFVPVYGLFRYGLRVHDGLERTAGPSTYWSEAFKRGAVLATYNGVLLTAPWIAYALYVIDAAAK